MKRLPLNEKVTLNRSDYRLAILFLIPILIALFVWLSALAFVPVPWPDDSAFYFVAKELFKWPPHWVMLPQAPFEPTYRIFNFNTMPLYPILIGIGTWIGIDGSFLLKLWPLGAWALTGSLLVTVLYRKGLPFAACSLLAFTFALDPEMRWASVLVRPESLIGLFGMALLLGLTFGFPKRFQPKGIWDPVSALLALAAYSHFNAIHLIPMVVLAFIREPKRLIKTGAIAVLYLSPWILMTLVHWDLFTTQMNIQWARLNVPNSWLSSIASAVQSLFQNMGSPEFWPTELYWTAYGMWAIVLCAIPLAIVTQSLELLPALGWIAGSIYLFQTKPEVWFLYYFHCAVWGFSGIALLKLWQMRKVSFAILSIGLFFMASIFGFTDISQAIRLSETKSWNWDTYHDFVSCVDNQLIELERKRASAKPFQVWCPTFPDITIELSRRHPQWELTRTNDFWQRADLAVQHGKDVDAVVVTETLGGVERNISAKPEEVPNVQSLWMLWKEYFLYRLWTTEGWKPNRYICQRGRWQAFLFMK